MKSAFLFSAAWLLAVAAPAVAQDASADICADDPSSVMELVLPGTGEAISLGAVDEAGRNCILPPPPPPRPAAPHVFGSVALAVGATSLDAHWQRVRAQPISAEDGPWGPLLRQIAGADPADQLRLVNNWVNSSVQHAEDQGPDWWTAATETLARGKGDCEDFAITKMQILEQAGFATSDLYLVIVRDMGRSEDHAVLAVRRESGFAILDSRTNHLLMDRAVADYRPIFTFGGQYAWTHGYQSGAAVRR